MVPCERYNLLHRLTLHSQLRTPDTVPRVYSNLSFREVATLHPVLECSLLRFCSGYYYPLPPLIPKNAPSLWLIDDLPDLMFCCPTARYKYVLCSLFPKSPFYLFRFFNVARLQTCYMNHRRSLKSRVLSPERPGIQSWLNVQRS